MGDVERRQPKEKHFVILLAPRAKKSAPLTTSAENIWQQNARNPYVLPTMDVVMGREKKTLVESINTTVAFDFVSHGTQSRPKLKGVSIEGFYYLERGGRLDRRLFPPSLCTRMRQLLQKFAVASVSLSALSAGDPFLHRVFVQVGSKTLN